MVPYGIEHYSGLVDIGFIEVFSLEMRRCSRGFSLCCLDTLAEG